MECSVCYCETANCSLTCGHSFCFNCVKEWYHKCSEPTCPMCRQALNFKGLHRLKEKWNEEAYQQKVDEVFGEYLDDMLDGCVWLEFLMFDLEEAQKHLQTLVSNGWDFDRDLFEGVMYNEIDLRVERLPPEFDEPKTFERTMFASKTPIRKPTGMANRRHRENSLEPMIVELIVLV